MNTKYKLQKGTKWIDKPQANDVQKNVTISTVVPKMCDMGDDVSVTSKRSATSTLR